MATTTHPAELSNGIWTSWLPVTSAWTSQSACNTAAWARVEIQSSSNYWPYIYDPAYAQSVANSLTCLPPEATSWWDGGVTAQNTVTSYSIGPIVCPGAYTTASTIVIDKSSTSVMCCPTNYNFARSVPANGGIDGVCTSKITPGQTFAYASPVSNSFTSVTTALSGTGLMIAVPVEGYNFAASTTSSSSSSSTSGSSSTSASTVTGASQTSATSTGSSTNTNTNTSAPSSGLSTGAKAGIGVGAAAVAIIALIGLGICVFQAAAAEIRQPPYRVIRCQGKERGLRRVICRGGRSKKVAATSAASRDGWCLESRISVTGCNNRIPFMIKFHHAQFR